MSVVQIVRLRYFDLDIIRPVLEEWFPGQPWTVAVRTYNPLSPGPVLELNSLIMMCTYRKCLVDMCSQCLVH